MLVVATLLFLAQIEHPAIPDGSVSCQTIVKFSPKAGVDDLLVNEIALAQERIRIAILG
jgi:hypothetical protein